VVARVRHERGALAVRNRAHPRVGRRGHVLEAKAAALVRAVFVEPGEAIATEPAEKIFLVRKIELVSERGAIALGVVAAEVRARRRAADVGAEEIRIG